MSEATVKGPEGPSARRYHGACDVCDRDLWGGDSVARLYSPGEGYVIVCETCAPSVAPLSVLS